MLFRSHVHISIHPEHNNLSNTLPYLDYNVSVLTYVSSTDKFRVVASSDSTGRTGRNGCTDDLCLEAGQYIIVPTSSGCALRLLLEGFPVVSETLCRVCSKASVIGSLPVRKATVTEIIKYSGIDEVREGQREGERERDGGGGGGGGGGVGGGGGEGDEGEHFTSTVTAAYTHLFSRLDVDKDGYLNHCELEHFIRLLEGTYALTQETYAWFLDTFDSTSFGVSLKGFVDCQFHVFKEQNRTAEEVYQELSFFGYRSTGGASHFIAHNTQNIPNYTDTVENSNTANIGTLKAISLEQTGKDTEHGQSTQVLTALSSTAAVPVRASTVRDQCQCPCELTYVTGISATVVVHTSSPHDLRAKPPDAALSALVSEIGIMREGRPHVMECCTMYVRTCCHTTGEAFGVSFLIVNTCQESVIFTVDYTGSVNVCSNNGKMVNTVMVGAGSSSVILHLR